MSPGLDIAGGHLPPAPPDTFRTGICPQRSRQASAGLVGRSIYLTRSKVRLETNKAIMTKAHEEGGDLTSSERLASAFLLLRIAETSEEGSRNQTDRRIQQRRRTIHLQGSTTKSTSE